jgi:hypothetical protein
VYVNNPCLLLFFLRPRLILFYVKLSHPAPTSSENLGKISLFFTAEVKIMQLAIDQFV